jgi:uncharacterized protein (DUF1501 family)
MPTRRTFLRTALRTSSLLALAPAVPGFLARTARAAPRERDGRVLVVVELSGGNDGINTVVPFADEGYARHRQLLRVPTDRLLRVNDQVGLHPALRGAARLLESGRLAIVQGVGYPNPNRSHFESMAIWQTARLTEPTHQPGGWIGRALEETPRPDGNGSGPVFVGVGAAPVALTGRRVTPTTVSRLDDALLRAPAPPRSAGRADLPGDDLAAFVRRAALDAYATSDALAEVVHGPDPGAGYPATALAERLRLVARLLRVGVGARVLYTTQPGYDTHFDQPALHPDLLAELGGALQAFLDDLAAAGLAERVLVLAFSEFGRRVQENGTRGTDHGTAGPVFLAGPGVRAGLAGTTPSLSDLDDGDLRTCLDFRRVYATVLEAWLGVPSRTPLHGTFELLPLLPDQGAIGGQRTQMNSSSH